MEILLISSWSTRIDLRDVSFECTRHNYNKNGSSANERINDFAGNFLFLISYCLNYLNDYAVVPLHSVHKPIPYEDRKRMCPSNTNK